MAYREKGIPPERRLNIRGKMGRVVLAVTAVAGMGVMRGGAGTGAGTAGGRLWRRASDHPGCGDGRGRWNPGAG